jgi:hypothetical protein
MFNPSFLDIQLDFTDLPSCISPATQSLYKDISNNRTW